MGKVMKDYGKQKKEMQANIEEEDCLSASGLDGQNTNVCLMVGQPEHQFPFHGWMARVSIFASWLDGCSFDICLMTGWPEH